jgi:hypothetical protein
MTTNSCLMQESSSKCQHRDQAIEPAEDEGCPHRPRPRDLKSQQEEAKQSADSPVDLRQTIKKNPIEKISNKQSEVKEENSRDKKNKIKAKKKKNQNQKQKQTTNAQTQPSQKTIRAKSIPPKKQPKTKEKERKRTKKRREEQKEHPTQAITYRHRRKKNCKG